MYILCVVFPAASWCSAIFVHNYLLLICLFVMPSMFAWLAFDKQAVFFFFLSLHLLCSLYFFLSVCLSASLSFSQRERQDCAAVWWAAVRGACLSWLTYQWRPRICGRFPASLSSWLRNWATASLEKSGWVGLLGVRWRGRRTTEAHLNKTCITVTGFCYRLVKVGEEAYTFLNIKRQSSKNWKLQVGASRRGSWVCITYPGVPSRSPHPPVVACACFEN